MKYLLSIVLFICFFIPALGQNIGIKANTGLSTLSDLEFEAGIGVYVDLNDFSDKVEVLFSFDYNSMSEFTRENYVSNCERAFVTAAGLYVIPISGKLKFKPGLALSHENLRAIETGQPFSVVNTYYAKHLGISAMTNLQFQKIFDWPLNFDIFLTPTYLINININNYKGLSREEYSKEYFVLNFQVGLSYVVK